MAQMLDNGVSFDVYDPGWYLNILLVNRQTFQEAVHCFYSINRFFCISVHTLAHVLDKFGPSRCQYIRHIAFECKRGEEGKLKGALHSLAELTQLRKLDIALKESAFRREAMTSIEAFSARSKDNINEFNVPGLHILRKMRHRTEITFHGDCANLAASFEVEPIVQAGEGELESETEEENEIIDIDLDLDFSDFEFEW